MVRVEKNVQRPPSLLMDSKWDELKADVLINPTTHKAKTSCYRDCTLEELTTLYKNKCAICERDRGIELQVDHYRPRKARANKTNPQYNNPGYYWLTYEWSNLIPMCSACNVKKSNKFPLAVASVRVSSHVNIQGLDPFLPYDITWLNLIEQPLIVNPETDPNPSQHFLHDRNGKIRSKTDIGRETIKIFDLNRRELKRQRIKVRNDFVAQLILSFNRYLDHRNAQRLKGTLESIFDTLIQGTNVNHELSLYHLYLFKYFDYFIGTKLPEVVRLKTLDYFEEYKMENNLSENLICKEN